MTIQQILMNRDDITFEDANDMVEGLRHNLMEHLDNDDMDSAYSVMAEVGLEPDYLMELIG